MKQEIKIRKKKEKEDSDDGEETKGTQQLVREGKGKRGEV